MGNELAKRHKLLLFVYMGLVLFFLGLYGCASAPKKIAQDLEMVPPTPKVKAIRVRSPNAHETLVEVVGSRPLPYTTFKLGDPPRIIVDLQAVPEPRVLQTKRVDDGNIKQISVARDKYDTKATRVVILLARAMNYDIVKKDHSLFLTFNRPLAGEGEKQEPPEKRVIQAQFSSPRIFFKPGKDHLTQILGVDFTMLKDGRSRLTITTSRKAVYALERVGPKTILLDLENATISPLLMRRLDSTYFKGVLDRVKANLSREKKRVSLDLTLREMVPFHIDRTDSAISIDFAKTKEGPWQEKPVPVDLTRSKTRKGIRSPGNTVKVTSLAGPTTKRRVIRRKYIGALMTMDFANADVTNILRLIGEVSNLNIIWGPEVRGKVSMRLRNVPWDQALDLVLQNNDLGKLRQGNVIWVTTREKIARIEAEEKKKREQEEAERKKRLEAEKEAKAAEPLVTEYLTVNYVDVDTMKNLIKENVKGPRGKLSVDTANKTIIMTDTAANIRAAKELKARQDKPVKQVMIEARIVEAAISFSRELGVKWGGSYQTQHNPWGSTGGGTYNYNFSTNFQIPSATTAGMSFVNTAATKLINAQIALSETEGQVKTLSAPKIMARNGVTAKINQGTQIFEPAGTDANGNMTYQAVDASLQLEVTPHILPSGMVTMKISVQDNYPDYANAKGENIPIKTKSAETEMTIASGDTVVIGGIYKEDKSATEEGTPWLRNLPILGWLFKTRKTGTDRSELLIFLTPTIVPDPGSKSVNEVRRKEAK